MESLSYQYQQVQNNTVFSLFGKELLEGFFVFLMCAFYCQNVDSHSNSKVICNTASATYSPKKKKKCWGMAQCKE